MILVATLVAASSSTATAQPHERTTRVRLDLLSGGGISGLVVDHNMEAVVLVSGETPHVFAWEEVEASSAYRAMRAALSASRGGQDKLSVDDHLQLGRFCLSRSLTNVASKEFRTASRIDPNVEQEVREALEAHRQTKKARRTQPSPLDVKDGDKESGEVQLAPSKKTEPGLAELIESAASDSTSSQNALSPEYRAKVRQAYLTFGAKVQEVMGDDVVLVETDHFLIWTNADAALRDRLGQWCEGMYDQLSNTFGYDPEDNIFIAKCPVFCWRNRKELNTFARQFDGYTADDAAGYSRSIAKSGHVHIAICLTGQSKADLDSFACTLVHEGTHAFVHRVYRSTLIPNWVNEGLAELTTERVLKNRCFTGEKADLLAWQYVKHDWSIGTMIHTVTPIEVHQYALAHSLVEHLEGLGAERFGGLIRELKEGETFAQALADNYDGQSPTRMTVSWREWVRQKHSKALASP